MNSLYFVSSVCIIFLLEECNTHNNLRYIHFLNKHIFPPISTTEQAQFRMSLFSCVEVAVCLDKIYTITARSPALYSLRFSVYFQNEYGRKIHAIPYNLARSPKTLNLLKQHSCLDNQSNTYTSTPFAMRITGEEFLVHEICSYRLFVPTSYDLQNQPLYVKVELVSKTASSDKSSAVLDPIVIKFLKTIAIDTYSPVYFTSLENCGAADLTVHSQLLSYRFRLLKAEMAEKQSDTSHICTEKPEDLFESFETFLADATHHMEPSQLEQFYSQHMNTLKIHYSKLKSRTMDLPEDESFHEEIEMIDFDVNNIIKSVHQHLQSISTVSQSQDPDQDLKIQESITNWASKFLGDSNQISGHIFRLWKMFIRSRLNFKHVEQLKRGYSEHLSHYYKRFMFKNIEQPQREKILANCFKKNVYLTGQHVFDKLNSLFIIEECFGDSKIPSETHITDPSLSMLLEEEEDQPARAAPQHIVMLVHGYSANRFALEFLKNALKYIYPEINVVVSTCNEMMTEDHIEDMGRRLAEEVKKLIQLRRQTHRQFQLSFVAHSLGGIIVRSALQYLGEYRDNMRAYISLGTPHLGYMYNKNILVKTGLYLMNRFNEPTSTIMLAMDDKPVPRDTYLYGISHQQGFNWFKYVQLLASPQDSYAPMSSALIREDKDVFADNRWNTEKARTYVQMVRNLDAKLAMGGTISRVEVHFDKLTAPLLDRMTGRKAHIAYLSDPDFINLLLHSNRKLFQISSQ